MKTVLPLIGMLLLMIGAAPTAFAQEMISGTVIDKETGDPIPYAYIRKKRTNIGAITNEDGYFQLRCTEQDTLIISFVSYDRRALPATYFMEQDKCYLQPSKNELSTVEVYANFDFLFRLFDQARKNLKRSDDHEAKTYFSLESGTRGVPVELLECYYNSETGPSGLIGLGLKNGRIGMSKIDETYYASLHSTYIMSNYHLYLDKGNRFPSNPLHLSKRKLQRYYKMKLQAFENNVYKIKFVPRKGKGQFFESTVWIDKGTERILKIKLEQENVTRHPFIEIDPRHNISGLNLSMDYTFTNTADQLLEKLEFSYDLMYDNRISVKRMETNGVFLFYDYQSTFNLPHYSETAPELSDYDKVVAQPYNEWFWKYNEVLSPSKKVLRYRTFFEENGVLLNFDELAKRNNDVFQNRIRPWSEERMFTWDINADRDYNINVTSLKDYGAIRSLPPGQLYDLVGHIYLDRNTFGDSTSYLSKTLIDREKSFFYLRKNQYTGCLINLYFDLIEIERRRMMVILESNEWSEKQADSIYYVSQFRLENELKQLMIQSDYGQEKDVVLTYTDKVQNALGVNNELLIIDEKFIAEEKKHEEARKAPGSDSDDFDPRYIELYNYGSALLSIGQYDESIGILLKAYNMGANDPWLYYNIGINFLYINRAEEACPFLLKSKEMGEEVDPKFIEHCFQ